MNHVRTLEVNGLPAATGTLSLRKRGQRSTLRLTVIRFGGGLIRFASTVRRGGDAAADLHWQTVLSFQPLASTEVPPEAHIEVHQVSAGEAAATLAAPLSAAEFRVLNGLGPAAVLHTGQLVKLVSY